MTDQTPSSPSHQEPLQTTAITSTSPPDQASLDEDQRQKEALAAFTATLHSVGTNLEAPLRERATIINSNALSLERQEADLAGQSAKLARQNEGWERMADETRAELKEIGDVQNWAEVIERDLLVLESMMDEVEGVRSEDEDSERMSLDGDEERRDGVVGHEDHDVEMNGNGTGNGNGNVDANKDEVKKKRRSWFSWW